MFIDIKTKTSKTYWLNLETDEIVVEEDADNLYDDRRHMQTLEDEREAYWNRMENKDDLHRLRYNATRLKTKFRNRIADGDEAAALAAHIYFSD